MATRPKAVIESRNGEKFSPITIAKNVLTDDGQNLHDILSDRKEDMMTPTIENSSSMFKVGQGDNVDYSANVVNGAYESMVLKGKTMVNCIQESSSQDIVLPYEFTDGHYVTINDTKESGALGVELKGQTLVNLCSLGNVRPNDDTNISTIINNVMLLKSNTKYIIKADIVDVIEGSTTSGININILMTNTHNNGSIEKSESIMNDLSTTKINKIFTTTSNTTHFKLNRSYGNATFNNLMILEYQEGMENWDIPYFTGMASCKMPILTTTGKNLTSLDICYDTFMKTVTGHNNTTFDNGVLKLGWTGTVRRANLIENVFKPNTQYTLSYWCKAPQGSAWQRSMIRIKYTDGTESRLSSDSTSSTDFTRQILVSEPNKTVESVYVDLNNVLYINQIQLEESTTATPYEPYKSSILSLPEEVVLRSLPNGVCDTFNTRTGVYTQRIGDDTFTGTSNENWIIPNNYTTGDTLPFRIKKPTMEGNGNAIPTDIICDKMKIVTPRNAWGNDSYDKEGLSHGTGKGDGVDVRILKSKLTTHDVAGFKAWLSQNPIRVQYQLHTPIVTKINLPSTLKSWNTTTHIYSEIPDNTLYPILTHLNPTYPVILKPSTKYSIVANSYSNGHTNSTINFNLGGATASTTVGNRVTTITTPSTLSNELLTMSGRGNKLNNVMVIEGEVVGDEPYFEGICDCKSPILLNVGKNLLPTELSRSFKHITGNQVVSSIDLTSFLNRGVQYVIKLAIPKNVKIAKHYSSNSADTESVLVSHGVINSNNTIARFTIPSNSSSYYLFVNESGQSPSDYISDISELVTIELDTGNVPTEITPYKSNTTTFDQKDDKTIVLRSLPNGVCDTLNVETGEYMQRIGEVVLDGSDDEKWFLNMIDDTEEIYVANISISDMSKGNDSVYGFAICDKLVYAIGRIKNTFKVSGSANEFIVRISFDLLQQISLNGFKQYLQQNPITIQYELATPIVSTIDIQGFPYAYTNGHVQLSSGHSGQSLTPKVEYSVVTNRNGQIRSNQKMVERHQKQLDRLQAMVLTNLVNTQYEQTLTNLKYDLKNVREEVK